MSNPPVPPNPFRITRLQMAADDAAAAVRAQVADPNSAAVLVAVVVVDPTSGAVVYRGTLETVTALQHIAGMVAGQFSQLVQWAESHGARRGGPQL